MIDIIDAVIKKTVDDTISVELKENKKEKTNVNYSSSIVKNNSNLTRKQDKINSND
ncbi:MAG: hypothetical protein FWG85_08000 [Bacteroidetes bacterium]|nr:hypothetical protein [Bacteroidota bacterium]